MKRKLKELAMNLLGYPVTLPLFVLHWAANLVLRLCDAGLEYIVTPYAKFLRRIFKL